MMMKSNISWVSLVWFKGGWVESCCSFQQLIDWQGLVSQFVFEFQMIDPEIDVILDILATWVLFNNPNKEA